MFMAGRPRAEEPHRRMACTRLSDRMAAAFAGACEYAGVTQSEQLRRMIGEFIAETDAPDVEPDLEERGGAPLARPEHEKGGLFDRIATSQEKEGA